MLPIANDFARRKCEGRRLSETHPEDRSCKRESGFRGSAASNRRSALPPRPRRSFPAIGVGGEDAEVADLG
jgi:hypothetical protein